MASRHAAFDDCRALDRHHVWDDGAPRGDSPDEVIGELGALGGLMVIFLSRRGLGLGRALPLRSARVF